jgi:hypothetical protein
MPTLRPKSIRPGSLAPKLARMHLKRPIISEHRLQRLHRWAMLWLRWFAAFLQGAEAFAPLSTQARRIAHQWLDRIEQLIVSLILIRAASRVRFIRAPRHSAQVRKETALPRAVLGSALRKSLRAKDLGARIEALSQNINTLVARLFKRLPRGLTRRRPIRVRPETRSRDTMLLLLSAAPASDTS